MDSEKKALYDRCAELEAALDSSVQCNMRLQRDYETLRREHSLVTGQIRLLMADRTYDSPSIQ